MITIEQAERESKERAKRAAGGPAFPSEKNNILNHTGMTLRDYFAAKAMPYLMSAYEDIDAVARVAYAQADAMLRARDA